MCFLPRRHITIHWHPSLIHGVDMTKPLLYESSSSNDFKTWFYFRLSFLHRSFLNNGVSLSFMHCRGLTLRRVSFCVSFECVIQGYKIALYVLGLTSIGAFDCSSCKTTHHHHPPTLSTLSPSTDPGRDSWTSWIPWGPGSSMRTLCPWPPPRQNPAT